ncbi:MAG: TRAM domain-containing protein [Armatimonadota bacterium]
MSYSSKFFRPVLTLSLVVLGAVSGQIAAKSYTNLIDTRLLSGRQEVLKLLGLIPINPSKLQMHEIYLLYAAFIIVGALLGFIIERVTFSQATKLRVRLENMAAQEKIAWLVGLILGLILTALLQSIFRTPLSVNIMMAVVLSYLAILAMDSLKEQVRFYSPGRYYEEKPISKKGSLPKVLDTNVIIDGRIADVSRAGFLEGPIYIPKFILEELQEIADSSDSLRRARGRRGLEILNQMQKEMDLTVPEIHSDDPTQEVDSRLVLVAKELHGAIVTNDYNLNKVAELQNVPVLNVNELANALKPVVLPGEEMSVTIIKEGKEKEQGIGYLDDGTMIVVEGGKKQIGETLDVLVTSVLQTVQGKMIFAKTKDYDQGETIVDEDYRYYNGGRQRRKIRTEY